MIFSVIFTVISVFLFALLGPLTEKLSYRYKALNQVFLLPFRTRSDSTGSSAEAWQEG
jgi:hypothetical protein